WSPDGTRIAFTLSHKSGREEIMVMSSDGSGEARLLPTTPDLFKTADWWTHDGLIFDTIGGQTFRDLWFLPLSGGGPARPLLQTTFSEYLACLSPDGRWMAYLSNEGGRDDVYIQSYPNLGHKVRVSSSGASAVWWMKADEIEYRTPTGTELLAVKLTWKGEG